MFIFYTKLLVELDITQWMKFSTEDFFRTNSTPCKFIKHRLKQKSFSCDFGGFYFTDHLRMTASGVFRNFWNKYFSKYFCGTTLPANVYLFKVNNRNTKKRYEMCSMLTIKTPERRHWRVFTVNFEHISHRFLVCLLLNLSK